MPTSKADPETPTSSEREMLKAIYRATIDGSDAHTGDLATALGVSPATVSTTVKRFGDRGLVDHEPYRGIVLTELGRRAAVGAIRRHRIVERFLADMLGYAWNEADRLAGSFEHELPQEVEERLYVALNRPDTCPHGFPIPGDESQIMPFMATIHSLEPGQMATVAVPGDTDPRVAEFLDEMGIRPGVVVEIREKHPFDGPLVLRVDGEDRTLGHKVAQSVFVQAVA